jgi:hypothetical protein
MNIHNEIVLTLYRKGWKVYTGNAASRNETVFPIIQKDKPEDIYWVNKDIHSKLSKLESSVNEITRSEHN